MRNINLQGIKNVYETMLFTITELHMKRNANMLDRLYNIRLSKIEVSIKMAKRTLKETEIHISKCNYL